MIFINDSTPQVMINRYMDMKEGMAPNALQTVGWAVLAMTVISFLFMPHFITIFYVSLSLLSICVGVIGGLALWGCHLDLVSLATILMSIGFAVDFSAHLCYRYQKSTMETPKDKLSDTLGHVGWPIIQAALSTLIGFSILAIVPAYLIRNHL